MKHNKIVEVNRELYAKIGIPRWDEKSNPTGFQRKLHKKKVAEATRSLGSGTMNCPPIILGNIGGQLICVDGQHRLAAWDRKPFPLQAVVYHYDSMEQAAKEFDVINSTNMRVSLKHRLNVSPNPYHRKVRALAAQLKVGVKIAHYAMVGVVNHDRPWLQPLDSKQWQAAEFVIREMKADPRWGSKQQVYSGAAMMRLAGYMVSRSKAPRAAIARLKALRTEKSAPFAQIVGVSNSRQVQMREYMFKTMARNGEL